MERTAHFFHYKHASLHYTISGSGNTPMLCFHGFGLTGESFYILEEALKKDYTFYNFDLFFHGKSEWRTDELLLSEEFWIELISAFINEKNISSFSLLGYSIGAKLVWSIAQNLPEKTKEIIVLAPDGLYKSFWYALATGSTLSITLFRLLLSKQNYIISIIKAAGWLRLAPKTTVRFAESQLRTKEQREKVYNTWIVYRKFKTNTFKLATEINEKEISFTIYLGLLDKIISYKKLEGFLTTLSHKNVITLEAGHTNLLSATIDYLNKQLSTN